MTKVTPPKAPPMRQYKNDNELSSLAFIAFVLDCGIMVGMSIH